MKNIFQFILCLGWLVAITACEDVVDVKVPNSEPKLVIEASIDWVKGTNGATQVIKLSESTNYFSTQQQVPALGAQVRIVKDEDGTVFQFSDQNNGNYTITSFVPDLGKSYTLTIVYKGETYVGKETFKPVVPIATVNQSVSGGFNADITEVNIFFNDPVNEENYYLTRFQKVGDQFPVYIPLDDEFTNGNLMTIFFERMDITDSEEEELKPGDKVDIRLIAMSKRYYNYMSLFLSQTDSQGPFATTPAQVRGNCVNTTNDDRYPFGYFRLSEVDETTYTVQ